jgi:hypothetical protein
MLWSARQGRCVVNARGLVRLGMFVIGMGIGFAVPDAAVASADTSSDPFGWLADLGLSAAAPQIIVEPNLAISFDGYSLLSDGTATADTTPGDFGLAIAYGSGAHADASGGFGDLAVVDGTNSTATTEDVFGGGGGIFNVAVVQGTGSYAEADHGNLDAAFTNGDDAQAFAGIGEAPGTSGIGDLASASGAGSQAFGQSGDFNTALANGANTIAEAQIGNGNFASVVDPTGTKGGDVFAEFGNGNVASAWGDQTHVVAGGETFNLLGDHDVATVIGDSSSAFSGSGISDSGSFDLAAVLFDNSASANATGADYLYDIITALGNESGAAAATSGSSFLSELASLF